MSNLKRTPLYPLYAKYETVRCIDFGGWEMPVQFYGILKEHEAVRLHAGLFDVSHMGEVLVTGKFAEAYLQRLTSNDVAKLKDNQAQYSLMCYPDGGVVDDLLVYRFTADQFMLVVNASNMEKDIDWLNQHLIGDVVVDNISDATALLALQGPKAEAVLSEVTAEPVRQLGSFEFMPDAVVCGAKALVSRTGYTGEDGFEIYIEAQDAPQVWEGLLQAGHNFGLLPAGLGARDTLRFEAKLPLYGQEISSAITPLEAGLGYFVKLDKVDFIGRAALVLQKKEGLRRKLAGIEMIDRGVPRARCAIYADERLIGEVTTGTQSPTLKRNLGLALIDSEYVGIGSEVWVDVRGKLLKARVVQTPFYKRTRT